MQSMAPDKYLPGVLIVDDSECVRSFLRAALEATARVVAEDHETQLALDFRHHPHRIRFRGSRGAGIPRRCEGLS